MSSARDLNTTLNELLKQVIPTELFKAGYIGEIRSPNQDKKALFIDGIKNSALADALYECLKFGEYLAPNHRSIAKTYTSYYICCGGPSELAETLSKLSPIEKAKLTSAIAESFIKKSCDRASLLVESLTGGIKRNGLENAAVAVEIRKMKDALKNPPKTLGDVFTLNDNLDKLANSYEQAKQNKPASTAAQSSAPKAAK